MAKVKFKMRKAGYQEVYRSCAEGPARSLAADVAAHASAAFEEDHPDNGFDQAAFTWGYVDGRFGRGVGVHATHGAAAAWSARHNGLLKALGGG